MQSPLYLARRLSIRQSSVRALKSTKSGTPGSFLFILSYLHLLCYAITIENPTTHCSRGKGRGEEVLWCKTTVVFGGLEGMLTSSLLCGPIFLLALEIDVEFPF